MRHMRMMVAFEKGFALRHIGHLDLMRTVQRALRRSGLPVTYSQGFHPHIELSFASPLGVGIVGMGEIMDVPLGEEISEEGFASKLSKAFPSSMRVTRARLIPDDFPTLMALVAASRYTLKLGSGEGAERVAGALPSFLALEECMTMRKTKSGEKLCNIRPFVKEAEAIRCEDGFEIRCLLEATPQGTLKPSLFMKCLSQLAEEIPFLAIREAILCQEKGGSLIPMEDYQDAW